MSNQPIRQSSFVGGSEDKRLMHPVKKRDNFAFEACLIFISESCRNACPRNYDPICVLNGEEEVTFPNDCEFKKEVCNSHRTDMIILRHSACQHENL